MDPAAARALGRGLMAVLLIGLADLAVASVVGNRACAGSNGQPEARGADLCHWPVHGLRDILTLGWEWLPLVVAVAGLRSAVRRSDTGPLGLATLAATGLLVVYVAVCFSLI